MTLHFPCPVLLSAGDIMVTDLAESDTRNALCPDEYAHNVVVVLFVAVTS